MYGQTIASLAEELGFKDWRLLSSTLKLFIQNSGYSLKNFANSKDSEIHDLAVDYAKRHGRKHWGHHGKGLVYPADQKLIVDKLVKVLVRQRRNTLDNERARLRLRRETSSDLYNDGPSRHGHHERTDDSEHEDDESIYMPVSTDQPISNASSSSVVQDLPFASSIRISSRANHQSSDMPMQTGHRHEQEPVKQLLEWSNRLALIEDSIDTSGSSKKIRSSQSRLSQEDRSAGIAASPSIATSGSVRAHRATATGSGPSCVRHVSETSSTIEVASSAEPGLDSMYPAGCNRISCAPVPDPVSTTRSASYEIDRPDEFRMPDAVSFELNQIVYSVGINDAITLFLRFLDLHEEANVEHRYLAREALRKRDEKERILAECRVEVLKQLQSSFRKELKLFGAREEE